MYKIQTTGRSLSGDENIAPAYAEAALSFEDLERGVLAALETYSNVHRGSGHNSMVSTHLFDHARDIVLEYLGLNKDRYVVIFCTPLRAAALKAQLEPESYQIVSSQDIGLPLGLRALAVRRKALPGGAPFHTGGGTTRLVSPGSVIWADSPERFEAGTPPIINIIAFARALLLIGKTGHFGNEAFTPSIADQKTTKEILYHDELENYSRRKLLDELRQTLIGRSVLVPTVEGPKPYINLDNAASTPTFTPIWNTVRNTWRQPSHLQQEIIQEVRSICSEALGASLVNYDVIFTSNTTEAINLTAQSLSGEFGQDKESVVLNSLLEHTSNELPWRMVPHFSLIRMNVDTDGFLDLKELEIILDSYNQKYQYGKKRIRLVAISGASNVLGIFNNLEEISRIVHQYGARLLVDAAQLVAHRKIDIELSGIDYLVFSAHKVYAPFGSGVLIARKGLLNFKTAELELIRSSGEENAGGIAALGKALLIMQRIGMDLIQGEEQDLTRKTLLGLSIIKGLRIYGISNPDSHTFIQKGGVIVFSLKGVMPDRLARELAGRGGIGIRYGCHCAHILIKHLLGVPPLLERFQSIIVKLFPKLRLPGVARVSLGIESTEKDIDTFIRVLGKIAGKTRYSTDRPSGPLQDGASVKQQADIERQINDFIKVAAKIVYGQL